MDDRLDRAWFQDQTTLHLARSLLGCELVHETSRGTVAGIICETEAYTETDEAAHSFGGHRTPKNDSMFASGGHLYVYFTYGIHYCANVVSEQEGIGSAVLLRAVVLTIGADIAWKQRMHTRQSQSITSVLSDRDVANGPAKLCQAFALDRQHNGTDLTNPRSPLYIRPATKMIKSVVRTPRIGISKATDKLWRFVIT